MDTLNSLETFLLSCVKAGLNSTYAILSTTGVGVGSSSPNLKRMAASGLLATVAGSRRKVTYSLTRMGEQKFKATLAAGPQGIWE